MGKKAFAEEPRRGPISLGTSKERIVINDTPIPPSGPADPRQRVNNGRRTPEPYRDLVRRPVLTGTYFEKEGRYRLFINHVGGHIECLLTLVVHDEIYHKLEKGADPRIPTDWGVTDVNPAGRRPLAYRFAGDEELGVFTLYVPSWLGSFKRTPERVPGMTNDVVGKLQVVGRGKLELTFELPFYGRWPKGRFTQNEDNQLVSIAKRHDDQPVLLDRYLGHSAIPFRVRTMYWFQLTPQQRGELGWYAKQIGRKRVLVDPETFRLVGSDGKKMDIYDLLKAERELEPGFKNSFRRQAIITAINRIVKEVFNYPVSVQRSESKRLGQADLVEMRLHVLRILDTWHMLPSHGLGEMSVGTALQRLLDRASDASEHEWLVKHLGMGPRGYRKFRYEIEIELFQLVDFDDEGSKQVYGMAKKVWEKIKKQLEKVAEKNSTTFGRLKKVTKYLPLTYLVGHATVSYKGVTGYTDPDAEEADGRKHEKPWRAEFAISLGGITASKSFGEGTSIKWSGVAEIPGPTPPSKEELEGALGYAQGDAFGGAAGSPWRDKEKGTWGGSLGGSTSFLAFYGRNFESPLTFWFDGEFEQGAGLGIGGKGLLGYASLLDGQGTDIDLAPKGKVEKDFDTYWRTRIATVAVHFPINGARLPVPTASEIGYMWSENLLSVKQALEAFAACELPLIAHPLAAVRVDGYADPPDDETSNLLLSLNRANTVANYLMGIVGHPFMLGLSAEGLLEQGRLAAVGHGEPESGKGSEGTGERRPSKRRKEQFDPMQRRVDVSVRIRDELEKEPSRTAAEQEPTLELSPVR